MHHTIQSDIVIAGDSVSGLALVLFFCQRGSIPTCSPRASAIHCPENSAANFLKKVEGDW